MAFPGRRNLNLLLGGSNPADLISSLPGFSGGMPRPRPRFPMPPGGGSPGGMPRPPVINPGMPPGGGSPGGMPRPPMVNPGIPPGGINRRFFGGRGRFPSGSFPSIPQGFPGGRLGGGYPGMGGTGPLPVPPGGMGGVFPTMQHQAQMQGPLGTLVQQAQPAQPAQSTQMNNLGAVGNRQMFAKGGVVQKYADGGLIGYASDLMGIGEGVKDALGQIAGGDYYAMAQSTPTAGGYGGTSTTDLGEVIPQEETMFTDATGMAEGGEPMDAMMAQDTMMAPGAMDEMSSEGLEVNPENLAMTMGEGLDPEGMAFVQGSLEEASQSLGDIENSDSPESMMDAVRGDQATMSDRRAELAMVVGEEDAARTPDSVLVLLQPVMAMNEMSPEEIDQNMDQGIGFLAQQEMQEPVQGDMAGGIMSMMGG